MKERLTLEKLYEVPLGEKMRVLQVITQGSTSVLMVANNGDGMYVYVHVKGTCVDYFCRHCNGHVSISPDGRVVIGVFLPHIYIFHAISRRRVNLRCNEERDIAAEELLRPAIANMGDRVDFALHGSSSLKVFTIQTVQSQSHKLPENPLLLGKDHAAR